MAVQRVRPRSAATPRFFPGRSQAVAYQGGEPAWVGIGAVLLGRERTQGDRVQVRLVDASPHRAAPLGLGQQFAEQRAQFAGVPQCGGPQLGSGDSQRVCEVFLHAGVGDHPREEAEERITGIVGAQRLASIVHDQLELVRHHRLEQGFLRREMPVDGTGADTRAARDVVERDRDAFSREGLACCGEDPEPVAPRIGPQGPLS